MCGSKQGTGGLGALASVDRSRRKTDGWAIRETESKSCRRTGGRGILELVYRPREGTGGQGVQRSVGPATVGLVVSKRTLGWIGTGRPVVGATGRWGSSGSTGTGVLGPVGRRVIGLTGRERLVVEVQGTQRTGSLETRTTVGRASGGVGGRESLGVIGLEWVVGMCRGKVSGGLGFPSTGVRVQPGHRREWSRVSSGLSGPPPTRTARVGLPTGHRRPP